MLSNTEYMNEKYGKIRDFYRWEMALDFFRLKNDEYMRKYGFLFEPNGELYTEASLHVLRGYNF